MIEDNAIIFRNLIWLNAVIVLTIKHVKIITTINILFAVILIISIIGAIFCHVSKINEFIHVNPSITSGNQKWNGAAPSFVINAVIIIIENELFIRGLIISFIFSNIVIAVIRTRDAMACVMKYFMDDSEENMFFLSEKRGITDKRLISRPIHILIHEYDEIATIVPIIMELKNTIL